MTAIWQQTHTQIKVESWVIYEPKMLLEVLADTWLPPLPNYLIFAAMKLVFIPLFFHLPFTQINYGCFPNC